MELFQEESWYALHEVWHFGLLFTDSLVADSKVLPMDADGRGPRHEVPSAVAITVCGNFCVIGGSDGSLITYSLQSGLFRNRYAVCGQDNLPKPRKGFVLNTKEAAKYKLGRRMPKPLEDIGKGSGSGVPAHMLGAASVWTAFRSLLKQTGGGGLKEVFGDRIKEEEVEEAPLESDTEESSDEEHGSTRSQSSVRRPFAHTGAITVVAVDATNRVSWPLLVSSLLYVSPSRHVSRLVLLACAQAVCYDDQSSN